MPKSQKERPWQSSCAKELLKQDIRDGVIDDDMDAKVVYLQRPEYAETEWRLFPGRLKSTRKQVTSNKERAKEDNVIYENTIQRFPANATGITSQGKLRWDGSDAQRLLKVDIDNGMHKTMEAKAFYNTRSEYKVFELSDFRDHIHQEIKRRKFLATFKVCKERNSQS